MEKRGGCGIARKEKREAVKAGEKNSLWTLRRRRVCGGCGEEEWVEGEEQNVGRRGMLATKNKASRAARSKILLLGVQGI